MIEEKSNPEKGLLFMLIGVGVGGVLAFLFAPKTRKQLRGDTDKTARKSLDKTDEFTAASSEKRRTFYQDTKIKADEFYETAKRTIDSAAASITERTGNMQNAAGIDGVDVAALAADCKKNPSTSRS